VLKYFKNFNSIMHVLNVRTPKESKFFQKSNNHFKIVGVITTMIRLEAFHGRKKIPLIYHYYYYYSYYSRAAAGTTNTTTATAAASVSSSFCSIFQFTA
jgi:hypothetical protein